jgi:hypothetical protein
MAEMPTAERVRERLSYDADTGVFRWREMPRRRAMPNGDVAGCRSDGYVTIRLDGKILKAHRLAWLYVHGVWPTGLIDHINGDKQDNRIVNLRDVDQHINGHNRYSVRNQFGVPGVYRVRTGRYIAHIMIHRRTRHIGTFETVEEAIAARRAAERQVFADAGMSAQQLTQAA